MKTVAGFLLCASVMVHAADMIDIRYQETEADGSSYQTRILVTDAYLRMDEGRDDGDFTLLDRKTRKIMNVLHDRKMIIAMHDRPLPQTPQHTYRVEKKVVPVREGTVRLQILADGKLCSETVAAAKLFPDAARAQAEYNKALAYTQWVTYRSTPAELRQDCDLVHHVWEADYALSQGLPIEERDYSGRVRHYIAGSKRTQQAELFVLPKSYEVFQLPYPEGDEAESSSQPSSLQAR